MLLCCRDGLTRRGWSREIHFEGALIRRSDVRLAVPILDRDGDLSSSRQGHRPQGRVERGGVRCLPLGLAAAR